VAVAIGVRRATGRGVGWLSEPVLRVQADATRLAPIEADARAALRALELPDDALVDLGPCGLPVQPQQRLQVVERPALEVRVAPTKGLRVLALLQGFPMGGYTAFNADLLPRLSAVGHTITTCTTEWWRSDWRLESVRATCPDIHHAHAVVPPMAVPAYVDWLIESRAIDVVLLSHSHLAFHLLPYLRARHPSVAFVDYVHTDWFEKSMYGSYASMAIQWASQLDAQLATSDALVSQLTDGGCDAAAVRAAHIGIDTSVWRHTGPRLSTVRKSLGATDRTLILLFSGRISPEKRPHLAVDVAAQLRAEGQDVVLVFAGSGQLLQATHERAEQCGLGDRCKFLGELDEVTLRAVYAASDIFIAPSEIEGIARSLYEAMAMGCIPVVSDVGGQRELVVPGTGSLVPADGNEATRYVEGVRPFLDRAMRPRASAAARAHIVAHFDTRRTVAIVRETFALACERRRTRQHALPAALAEEFAVLSLEIIRRHVLQAIAR
jgi:glycosyltransferase involved in cell wall biosynthesis